MDMRRLGATVSSKFFPDTVHMWLGRLVVLLGLGNVFLGMADLELPYWWFIVWGVVIVAWIALYVICSFKCDTKEEEFDSQYVLMDG